MEVRYSVNEGCKVLRTLKDVMKCRTMGMGAMRGLYKWVVVATELYEAEMWGMRVVRRKKCTEEYGRKDANGGMEFGMLMFEFN